MTSKGGGTNCISQVCALPMIKQGALRIHNQQNPAFSPVKWRFLRGMQIRIKWLGW